MSKDSSDLELALKKRRNFSLALLLFGFLLSSPLIFIFFGKSLDLQVLPKIDSRPVISVLEGLAPKVFDKYLIISSEVIFQISQKGFETVEVKHKKNGGLARLEVRLEALPGNIKLKVDYDGDFTLQIPTEQYASSDKEQSIELPAGLVEVYIDGPLLESFQKTLSILGQGKEQIFTLKPRRVSSQVIFSVSPKDSEVLIDGTARKAKDGLYEEFLEKGQHLLEFRNKGYFDLKEEISIKKNQELDLGEFSLVAKPVSAQFSSVPSEASVFINGVYKGSTPFRLMVTPKEKLKAKIRKSGFISQTYEFTPQVGVDSTKQIKLSKEKFEVSAITQPEAKILVNGDFVGVSPLSFSVSLGDKIRASSQGFVPVETIVSSKILEGHEFRIALLAEDEKAYVEAPSEYVIEDVKFKKVRGNLKSWIDYDETSGLPAAIDFYVSTTEITNSAFKKFNGKNEENSFPVTKVAWLQAIRYCNWLSERENLEKFYKFEDVSGVKTLSFDPTAPGYRLMTKTEWLYLISNGQSSKPMSEFPWEGSLADIPRGVGNLAGRELAKSSLNYLKNYADGFENLSPAASFRPTSLGIFDLVGNAKEWLHNSSVQSDQYFGRDYATGHLIAGSSFSTWRERELGTRNFVSKTIGAKDVGFRVARSLR